MSRAKQLFDLLEGIWRFRRSVVHKAPEEIFEGTGYAVFSLLNGSENTMKYYERVSLKNLRTQTEMKGYQKYEYRYDQENDRLVKHFNDGKVFYALSISDLDCLGDSLCIRDRYKAYYHFTDSNNFSLRYEVLGPKKDYTISTEYTRIEEQDIPELGITITDGEIGELSSHSKKK